MFCEKDDCFRNNNRYIQNKAIKTTTNCGIDSSGFPRIDSGNMIEPGPVKSVEVAKN
jgi:hypothetical protein